MTRPFFLPSYRGLKWNSTSLRNRSSSAEVVAGHRFKAQPMEFVGTDSCSTRVCTPGSGCSGSNKQNPGSRMLRSSELVRAEDHACSKTVPAEEKMPLRDAATESGRSSKSMAMAALWSMALAVLITGSFDSTAPGSISCAGTSEVPCLVYLGGI